MITYQICKVSVQPPEVYCVVTLDDKSSFGKIFKGDHILNVQVIEEELRTLIQATAEHEKQIQILQDLAREKTIIELVLVPTADEPEPAKNNESTQEVL